MREKRPTAVELSEEDRPAPKHLRPTSRGLIAANSDHSAPNLISTTLARTSRTSTTVQTAAEDAALGAASSSSTRTRSIGTRSAHDTPGVHNGWSRRYSNRSATHDGDVQRDTDSENVRNEDIANKSTDTHKSWTSRRSYGHAHRGSLARRDSNTLRSPSDKRSRGLRPMDLGSTRDLTRRRADTEVTRNSVPPSSVRSQTTGQAKWAVALASEEEPRRISDTDAEGRGADDGNEKCHLCLKSLQSTGQRQCGDCPIIICSGCITNAPLMLPGHALGSSTDSDRGDQNDPANEERESDAPTSIARGTPGREDERYLRRTSVETESVHGDQACNATCSCDLCWESLRMWWECGMCSINLCDNCRYLHPTEHQLLEKFRCPTSELHAEDREQDLGDLHAGQDAGSCKDSRPEMIEAEDDPAGGGDADTGGGDDEELIDEEETGHIGHEPASIGRPQRKRRRSSSSPFQPAQGQLSRYSPVPLDFRGLQGSRPEVVVELLRGEHSRLERMAQYLGIEPSLLCRGGRATQQTSSRRNALGRTTGHSAKSPRPRRGETLASRQRRRYEDDEGEIVDAGTEDGSDKDRSASDTNGNKRPRHKRDILNFSVSDLNDNNGRRAAGLRISRPWLPEDLRQLTKLKGDGWTNASIAEELDRTAVATSRRWQKLVHTGR